MHPLFHDVGAVGDDEAWLNPAIAEFFNDGLVGREQVRHCDDLRPEASAKFKRELDGEVIQCLDTHGVVQLLEVFRVWIGRVQGFTAGDGVQQPGVV